MSASGLPVKRLSAIAPWQEASIGTQIGGYQLIDVRVNVGDHVKKGQVLARLDPALLQADAAQLQNGDPFVLGGQQMLGEQNCIRLRSAA